MHRHRTQVRISRARGFSLIELMVVVAILSITAAIAVGAIRQDEVAGSYKRFVSDLQGKFIQGRDYAIDNQSQVQLTFFSDRVEMRTWNQITDVWDDFGAQRSGDVDGGILGNTCILGLQSGAVPPAEAATMAVLAPPNACLGGSIQLTFEPDGTFEVEGGLLENAGATLWVRDNTVASKPRLSMIQFFPGGLMRTFDDVD
jgi:prepilin-type N-terminal cleavage/methylation domain-containing protein